MLVAVTNEERPGVLPLKEELVLIRIVAVVFSLDQEN